MTHTVDSIRNLLATNDKAVARALLALNARQTADEQITQHTRHDNGRGFRPCHARMGTSMAKFYERNGYLSQADRILAQTGSHRYSAHRYICPSTISCRPGRLTI